MNKEVTLREFTEILKNEEKHIKRIMQTEGGIIIELEENKAKW